MVMMIFRSHLRPEHAVAYYETVARMQTLAEGMPGFMSFKTLKAKDGERVSVVESEF
jgi:heme-degrading monooxygenase HmoA